MSTFPSPASPATDWVAYYEKNAARENRLPFDQPCHDTLTASQRAALVRTLQRFHLGESGEGEHLKRFAKQTSDATYCRAIELFVAEEQAHSRWFGRLLERLDAPPLQAHWSDALFTQVRRAKGLHFELVTFLTAEIVGHRFFALLSRNCPEPVAATVFAQVVRDESAHIAFHIDTLRRAFEKYSPASRLLWHWKWKAMLLCAIAIVCLDQGAIFAALNLSRAEFAAGCFDSFHSITTRIWSPRKASATPPKRPQTKGASL